MERLKGKKLVEKLFMSGAVINAFPLRLVFIQTRTTNRLGVSVGKKKFKSAVIRNKIKRQLRAACKDHLLVLLGELDSKYNLMVLYSGEKKPKPTELDKSFKLMVERFKKKVLENVKAKKKNRFILYRYFNVRFNNCLQDRLF